ncbi:MAG: acyl-CoA dehydrogenase family protein [Candidatus Binatia bacterium]
MAGINPSTKPSLYLRDAKSYQIVEGSSNIQKLIIAQDALGYRKANRAT